MTIYLEHIFKSYGEKEALKDFNLSVEDDKCYVLAGPEGSGKTTALKIFLGLVKPDSGKVSRMGDYKYPSLRSAYVPQEESLNAKKNAVWNVRKAHRTASKKRAIEELGRFLSPDEMSCPVSELSGGKRQIVKIVKALFVPADFIVLDEPFDKMTEDERKAALEYILGQRGSRPLLIATENEPGDSRGFIIRHMQ
ncbi:MAG: ATP-binding cassette domain-containing protein [Lachnospiraceae bacterium]|nr:ATP-binding cassette domain-containing protein [Lachnospiraceae bacterium]